MALINGIIDTTGLTKHDTEKLKRDWDWPDQPELTTSQLIRIDGPEHLLCDCHEEGGQICELLAVPCMHYSRYYADLYENKLRVMATTMVPGKDVTVLEDTVAKRLRKLNQVN